MRLLGSSIAICLSVSVLLGVFAPAANAQEFVSNPGSYASAGCFGGRSAVKKAGFIESLIALESSISDLLTVPSVEPIVRARVLSFLNPPEQLDFYKYKTGVLCAEHKGTYVGGVCQSDRVPVANGFVFRLYAGTFKVYDLTPAIQDLGKKVYLPRFIARFETNFGTEAEAEARFMKMKEQIAKDILDATIDAPTPVEFLNSFTTVNQLIMFLRSQGAPNLILFNLSGISRLSRVKAIVEKQFAARPCRRNSFCGAIDAALKNMIASADVSDSRFIGSFSNFAGSVRFECTCPVGAACAPLLPATPIPEPSTAPAPTTPVPSATSVPPSLPTAATTPLRTVR